MPAHLFALSRCINLTHYARAQHFAKKYSQAFIALLSAPQKWLFIVLMNFIEFQKKMCMQFR